MPRLRSLAPLAALIGIAIAAQAAEVEHQDLRRIESEIDQGRERRDSLDARSGEIGEAISALQVGLVAAAAKAQEMEDVVSSLETRLAALAAEERAKVARLDERRAVLAATLGALARLGRRPPEALVAAAGSAIETVRGSIVLAAVAPELGAEALALGAEIQALDLLRADIDNERDALVAARRALDKEQHAIERLIRRKSQAQSRTVAERAAESERLAALAAEAADVRALLSELQAAAAEADLDFAAARGTMPFPARGRLATRFGEATDFGTPSRGVTIETQPGAQVIAPHEGRVVFAGPFRSYGQLLIIAHGERYHTLLAGLSRVGGVVGQWVLAGEPVGRMSEDDGAKPLLYLEVRRDGEPVNPLAWLAASDGKVSG